MSRKIIPTNGKAVTPHDTTYIVPGTLYIGVSGDLNVLLVDMTDSNDSNDGLVYKDVPIGDFPREVKKVFATGTDATNIIQDL